MKRLAAVTSMLVLAVPAAVLVAPSADAAHRVARVDVSSLTGDATQLQGHGELAVIGSDRQLYLLGGDAQGVQKVTLDAPASRPLWSHDGRWLAVTTRPDPPSPDASADMPTSVWLVSASGEVVRELTPTDADVYHAAAAWSPKVDQIAIEYTAGVDSPAGATQQLVVVETSGNVTPLASAQNISGFAWAPDGQRIAVGLNHFETSSAKWKSRLVTMVPQLAGARHTVTTDLGDILVVAGWWPDGSGVLAWLDFQGSGSLAADGLPLLDVALKSGHRRQLAKTMLQYPGWLATSKLRNKVALIAGGDRILTNGHKHLVICTLSNCHQVAQGDHQVTFSPQWSADGQLAAVRDRAIKPMNGDYSLTFTKQVEASGGVDLLRNGHLRAVAGAERGTAPVWDKTGAVLFVRGGSLYLLQPETKHAHRVAGTLDASNGFFGFVSWWDSFAWSAAVRDDVPLGTAQVI